MTRETAVARLTLLGARAVERLIAAAVSGGAERAGGAWRALEADRRRAGARTGARRPGIRGRGICGRRRRGRHRPPPPARRPRRGRRRSTGDGAAGSDARPDRQARRAARPARSRAGDDCPDSELALRRPEPDRWYRSGVEPSGRAARFEDAAAVVMRAADGQLPEDPATLRHALNLSSASAPPPQLLKVIDRVREREGSQTASVRDQWRLARAAAHLALAHRGSGQALYDLRESLDPRPARVHGAYRLDHRRDFRSRRCVLLRYFRDPPWCTRTSNKGEVT